MEIKIELPGGAVLEYKRQPRQPMSQTRFEMIFWLVGFIVFGHGVLKFIGMLV